MTRVTLVALYNQLVDNMSLQTKQENKGSGGILVGLMAAAIVTRYAMPDLKVSGPTAFFIAFLLVSGVYLAIKMIYKSGRVGKTLVMATACVTLPVFSLGVSVDLPVVGLLVGLIAAGLITAMFFPLTEAGHHDLAPETMQSTCCLDESNDEGHQTRSQYPIQRANGVVSAFY